MKKWWDRVSGAQRRREDWTRQVFDEIHRLDSQPARSWSPAEPVAPRRRWGRVLVLFMVAALGVGWWVTQSAPTAYVVGDDGVWRPRLSNADLQRPGDARDQRILEARESTDQGSFAFMQMQEDSTEPVTYDPCSPIHVEINPRTGPAHAVQLVQEALDIVEDASGLQFIVDGVTGREVDFESFADVDDPVIISWTDDTVVPGLAGRVAGLGGSQAAEKDGWRWYFTGAIALDGPDLAGASDQQIIALIMHELGHLLGLDHTHDTDELMHPTNSGQAFFGTGDLNGLAKLGSGPCIPW